MIGGMAYTGANTPGHTCKRLKIHQISTYISTADITPNALKLYKVT